MGRNTLCLSGDETSETADEAEVIAFCREHLAGFKTNKQVVFTDIPQNLNWQPAEIHAARSVNLNKQPASRPGAFMTNTYQIAVIPGDGIGVEVTDATLAVLEAVGARVSGYQLSCSTLMAGAAYYRDTGLDIEADGEERAAKADAIYLGAIGLPSIRRRRNRDFTTS